MKKNILNKLYRYLIDIGIYRFIPDKLYLKHKYRKVLKKELNLDNPKTFNEKLQWLKINDRKQIYTIMADKYKVKEYVANIIGEEYIIPTYGIWNKFDDIEFEKLPSKFVLKCTHDSGGVVICKDKSTFDIKKNRTKFNFIMKRNFYYRSREWVYKNIKPQILAEKYLENTNNSELIDYKLMCFNGIVKCSFVCTNRKSKDGLNVNFYDREWNPLPFTRHYPKNEKEIVKPSQYETMVNLAEKLSTEIPFVRIDFYEVDGKVYFGEMTFYPGSGLEEFTPDKFDLELGNLIDLGLVKKNEK